MLYYDVFGFISVKEFHIPKTIPQCRSKLREEFEKHRGVQDLRVIDMLVIKVSVSKSFL